MLLIRVHLSFADCCIIRARRWLSQYFTFVNDVCITIRCGVAWQLLFVFLKKIRLRIRLVDTGIDIFLFGAICMPYLICRMDCGLSNRMSVTFHMVLGGLLKALMWLRTGHFNKLFQPVFFSLCESAMENRNDKKAMKMLFRCSITGNTIWTCQAWNQQFRVSPSDN